MTDQYPHENISSLLGKLGDCLERIDEFTASLHPGEYIGAKPNFETARDDAADMAAGKDLAKQHWDLAYEASSYCNGVRAKQKAAKVSTSDNKAIYGAARSGDYSKIPGA